MDSNSKGNPAMAQDEATNAKKKPLKDKLVIGVGNYKVDRRVIITHR